MMEEKNYEVDTSEEGTYIAGRVCIMTNGDNLWFKPKQKFPIVFENNYVTILIYYDGRIGTIINNVNILYSTEDTLNLLEQAIAKSKEIRGLK